MVDGQVDAVICLEVLEHVGYPFRAAGELVRVLRPGGRLLLTVPFLTSYHGKRVGVNTPKDGEFPTSGASRTKAWSCRSNDSNSWKWYPWMVL
jgi:predicted SAM-dependent methyltransferase